MLMCFLDAEGVCGQRAAAAQLSALLREEESWSHLSQTDSLTHGLTALASQGGVGTSSRPRGRRHRSHYTLTSTLTRLPEKRKQAAR